MKRSIFMLGLAALTFGSTLLHADPIDPVYSMGDPGSGTSVTSPIFNFGSDAAGGGIFAFVNNSRIAWANLSISVIEPSNIAITILPGLFFNTSQFSAESQGNGTSKFTIGLFNTGAGNGGIAIGEYFTINLNDLIGNQQNTDPNGLGGWGNSVQFTGSANSVPGAPGTMPEPASLFLFAAGAGVVGWASRFKRRTAN